MPQHYQSELKLKYHNTGNLLTFVLVSACKNSINAIIGGGRMFLSLCALKSKNSTNRIQPRMKCASFNGNPCTTIVSCYIPTNVSEEADIITFYNELSSLRHILKHNILIISGDMNAQIGKDRNINSAYTNRQTKMGDI